MRIVLGGGRGKKFSSLSYQQSFYGDAGFLEQKKHNARDTWEGTGEDDCYLVSGADAMGGGVVLPERVADKSGIKKKNLTFLTRGLAKEVGTGGPVVPKRKGNFSGAAYGGG